MAREIKADNCTGRAAQLAYYFVFALFPFMLFLTSLLGYIPADGLFEGIMDLLGTFLPSSVLELVRGNVEDLVRNQRGGLLSFGIIMAVWVSSNAMMAISSALNRAYNVDETRPFWKLRGMAILVTIGLSLMIIAAMILLIFGPQIGSWVASAVGLGAAFELTWNIVRWPVIVFFLITVMAVIYYFAPNVDQKWQWITPGAVFAVIVTLLASLAFAFYVNNWGSYNKTYGSIGAVIGLLTWFYLLGFLILVGGEINSEVRRSQRGETKRPRPPD